jgi:amino acid transporter
MTLCICYLRFYAACKAQGLDRNTLPFKSRLQPYAGWVGAIGSLSESRFCGSKTAADVVVITLVSSFSVFLKGQWSTADFIAGYIGIPIYVIPFVAWKVIKRTKVSTG